MSKVNEAGNSLPQFINYHGTQIAVEIKNGQRMVNATQMAKQFRKRPADWLLTQQAKDLMSEMTVTGFPVTDDLQYVKKGGQNQGTWLHEELALIFAQWLSPGFYIQCNRKLRELLAGPQLTPLNGVAPMLHDGILGYPRCELLISVGRSQGNGYRLRYKYGKHCFNIGRTACISSQLAGMLVAERELKARQISLFTTQSLQS